jgi:hypothetical protein
MSDLACDNIGSFTAVIYQSARGPGEPGELVISGSNLAELVVNFKTKLAEAAANRDFTPLLSPNCRFEM